MEVHVFSPFLGCFPFEKVIKVLLILLGHFLFSFICHLLCFSLRLLFGLHLLFNYLLLLIRKSLLGAHEVLKSFFVVGLIFVRVLSEREAGHLIPGKVLPLHLSSLELHSQQLVVKVSIIVELPIDSHLFLHNILNRIKGELTLAFRKDISAS